MSRSEIVGSLDRSDQRPEPVGVLGNHLPLRVIGFGHVEWRLILGRISARHVRKEARRRGHGSPATAEFPAAVRWPFPAFGRRCQVRASVSAMRCAINAYPALAPSGARRK